MTPIEPWQPSSSPTQNPRSDDEEPEYIVENIIKDKISGGVKMYLTKFMGYPKPEWQAADGFADSDGTLNEKLVEYNARKKRKTSKTPKPAWK